MTARELREQRFKLVQDAHALTKNGFTAEARATFDKMMADADALKTDIDRLERADALQSELRTAPPNPRPGAGQELGPEERKKAEEAAFRAFLYKGHRITDEQRSFLREQTEFRADGLLTGGGNALQGTGGGYFVPVGFVHEVEEALKYFGPMLNGGPGDPTIMETATGQPLPYPTDNDTAITGERVGEANSVTQTGAPATVSLSAIIFNAIQYDTNMVPVSRAMMQDSAFPLQPYLEKKFAIRLGRILNADFTNGVGIGSGQPTGIVTAVVANNSSPVTAAGSNTNDGLGATGDNSIGSDDLINLEHSVDILYRRGAKYMMHDATLALLKRLKDRYGRPLWLPALSADTPDKINGYPYLINNDMDKVPLGATSSGVFKTVLFGDMSKYLIRRVKDLAVLRLEERFAEKGIIAFIGFARYDGNLLDAGTHPINYLTN